MYIHMNAVQCHDIHARMIVKRISYQWIKLKVAELDIKNGNRSAGSIYSQRFGFHSMLHLECDLYSIEYGNIILCSMFKGCNLCSSATYTPANTVGNQKSTAVMSII